MVLLTEYYDYELKKTAYKLSGEKGYAKNTTTSLELVSITDTNLNYCTATFKVNVIGDRATSQIIIYDNGTLIPVYYNNTEYRYLEWSNQNTNPLQIQIRLTYDTNHKLQAHYLANHRCLQSKSKPIDVFRDLPLTAQTEISLSFNNANRIYTASANPIITATLSILDSSENPNANRNQTITFLVDGTTKGTATTDNSGVASYTLNNVSVGYHTVTARYGGSEYLFGTETSTELSKGYQVKILENPRIVLNNDDVTVTASLTDFFDNPINNTSLTFAKTNGSHTSLSTTGTTDSDGIATLTMDSAKYTTYATLSNNVYTIPYVIRYSASEYSEDITTYDAINMTIDLTDKEYISANKQITEISGLVSPSRNNTFPVDVTIETNGITETVKTDNNGAFTYNYNGTGVGDTIITASINSASDTLELEDMIQYWKANNKSYNKKYKWIIGEFRELTTGFKLALPKNNSGEANLGIGDGTSFDSDYEISFKVIATNNLEQIGIKQWERGDPNSFYGHTDTDTTVANGDVIKAVNENGTMTTYKNGEIISTGESTNLYPVIWLEGGKGGYVLFDEFKFKVI